MQTQTIQTVFFDLGDTLVTSPRAWLPGAKTLLGSLKQAGFRLGIISNTTGLPDRQSIVEILPDDFDFSVFDSSIVLFSSEVGLEKPNKEIFQNAIVRSNTTAEHCVYCSENIMETLVAQHVGMRAIRIQVAPNSDLNSIQQTLTKFNTMISTHVPADHANAG